MSGRLGPTLLFPIEITAVYSLIGVCRGLGYNEIRLFDLTSWEWQGREYFDDWTLRITLNAGLISGHPIEHFPDVASYTGIERRDAYHVHFGKLCCAFCALLVI